MTGSTEKSDHFRSARLSSWIYITVIMLAVMPNTRGQSGNSLTDTASARDPSHAAGNVRLATYNVSLFGRDADEIAERFDSGNDEQIQAIVNVIRTVRPDVLLVNELDHVGVGQPEPGISNAERLAKWLRRNDDTATEPIEYPHVIALPSNTGVPSGDDLNGNGSTDEPNDAWGFGRHPGQYAMAMLSRYPIDRTNVRTFAKFRWVDLPGATNPRVDDGVYFDEPIWKRLRLSSKTHADIPLTIDGQVLHALVSHPTPPVFDGPEDRNGLRNRDEILFWKHYLDNSPQLVDDNGVVGGLDAKASFFVAGDLNSDPERGDSIRTAITSLIGHRRVTDPEPSANGNNATAEFGGGVRVDYVLPSNDLRVTNSGVFWPRDDSSAAKWVRSSDHRLVWVDVELNQR